MYILSSFETVASNSVVGLILVGVFMAYLGTLRLFPLFLYKIWIIKENKKADKLQEDIEKKRSSIQNFIDTFPTKEMTQEEFEVLRVASTELLSDAKNHFGEWFRFPVCKVTGERIVGQFVPFGKMFASQQGAATGSSPLFNRYKVVLIQSGKEVSTHAQPA